MSFSIKTKTADQTKAIAYQLGQLAKANDQITLNGQLGTGKTTFTTGFAEGLGVDIIRNPITSPTFNIVNSYDGQLKLHHFDLYRLENQEVDYQFLELIEQVSVSLLEWAQFAPELVKADHLIINFKIEDNFHLLEFKSTGQRSEDWLQQLIESYQNK